MTPATHLKPLTSVRFFAALWVVVYHYLPVLIPGAREDIALVERGRLGVELFFVLSGFILSHVYFAAVETKQFNYGAFMWARFARIYPLHLAAFLSFAAMAVVASVVGMDIGGGLFRTDTIWQNLTLTHAWGVSPQAAWNTPSWSISAEWFAYLLFPVFALVAMRFLGRTKVLVGLAALSIPLLYIIWQAAVGENLAEQTVHFGALRIVPTFMFGMALYLWFRKGGFNTAGRAGALTVSATLAMLVLSAIGAFDGFIVIAGGFIILGLAGLSQTDSKTLSQPVMVWLGEVSFAIYMFLYVWEIFLLKGYEKLGLYVPGQGLAPMLWMALPVGLMVIATIAHHGIERPARTWLRAVGPKKR